MSSKKVSKRLVLPNYFKEALEALTGRSCPIEVPRYGTTGMTDEALMALQDWCCMNARPSWATGLAMMEGAELVVEGAAENGNIPLEEKPRKEVPKLSIESLALEVTRISEEAELRFKQLGVQFWQDVLLPYCIEHQLTYSSTQGVFSKDLRPLSSRDVPLLNGILNIFQREVLPNRRFWQYVPSVELHDIIDFSEGPDFEGLGIIPEKVGDWHVAEFPRVDRARYAKAILTRYGYETKLVTTEDQRLLLWRKTHE